TEFYYQNLTRPYAGLGLNGILIRNGILKWLKRTYYFYESISEIGGKYIIFYHAPGRRCVYKTYISFTPNLCYDSRMRNIAFFPPFRNKEKPIAWLNISYPFYFAPEFRLLPGNSRHF